MAEKFFLQCDTGSRGCRGGFVRTALNLAMTYDVPTESAYPYTYQADYLNLCNSSTNPIPLNSKFPSTSVKYYASGINKMPQSQLITHLLQRPVAITLNADEMVYYYPDGTPFQCSSAYSNQGSKNNHAVLLVGYNATTWIVKNSWSQYWGDNGYIYITRNTSADCGIGYALYTLNFTLPAV